MTLTFLGASRPSAASKAIVLGAPMATVYPNRSPHASSGAAAIRAASARMAPFIGNYDFDKGAPFAPWWDHLADGGDIEVSRTDPEGNRRRISHAVRDVLGANAIPIVLGGDDSVTVPFVHAWRDHGPITVIQIDAHLDFRDEVDGEPFGYSSPMRRASEMDWVRRVIHIGQRGVGSARQCDVEASLTAGNVIIPAREFARIGPQGSGDRLEPGERFVVVYDVDGTDPAEVPAVRAPSHGGPRVDEIVDLLGALAARGTFEGIVVTEFEADLDPTGVAALAVVRILCRALDSIST